MPTLLQISQLGHPILRGKAKEVEDIHDPDIQTLIDDMMYTCQDAEGLGIAAPQVYQPLRLFIISSRPTPRYPNALVMDPKAIINPTIVGYSDETETLWESCLSIPGIFGRVERPKSLTISFTNRNGHQEEETLDDLAARVCLHEYDHIEGTIFLDLTKSTDLATTKEQARIAKATA